MQDGLLRGITKIDILKLYVTGELRIGDRAVLMRMLPCPKAGVLVGFGEHAVFLFGVDERDVALVLFALGIEQREDAGSACHSHDDGRDLLRDLADRHNEAAGELQERRDAAERHDTHAGEGQVRYACKCETAAKHGDEHVKEVAECVHDGAEDIGKLIRFGSVCEEVVVSFVELGLCFVFVAEDLDDLLAVNHFFDVAVHIAEGLLLANKVAAAFCGDLADDLKHDKEERDQEQGKPNAER